MKPQYLLPIFLLLSFVPVSGQIISQYIETSSGSVPKGIEIWNNTSSELNFSANNLVIEKGTNGAIPTPDFTLSSGLLATGDAIVIGTSDLQSVTESNGSVFYLKAFTFNGDDALVVKYGGAITDVFGIPGIDPGTAWTGSGLSTANQNIALKDGIETGDTDGWSDPSERYETISTDNSLTGFGIAPIIITGTLVAQPASLSNFISIFQQGPSSSQQFTVSGTDLSNNVVITPPSNYEISSDNIHFQITPVILTPSTGILPVTSIYVRLKAGLEVGRYFNEDLSVTSVGATEANVNLNGRVKYTPNMLLPNAWINEFHYENIGTDVGEFIEVVIENSAIFDLSDFSVSLYNGGDGAVYGTESGNNFNQGSTNNGFTFYTWHPGSIQNGSPDGFSVNYKGEAIQLLSYEGTFTATDGPASGMVSSDVGPSQSNTSTLPGLSLQLLGTGNQYQHFHWMDPPESPGMKNGYQYFGDPVPPVPVDYRITLLVFMLVTMSFVYRRTKTK
jgi:hypothetical protein